MDKEELEDAVEWLEDSDNQYRIARIIAEILDDVEEIRREFPR